MDSRSAQDMLDEFVDSLDYPMFVVTARHGRRRDGCLVGFATQTSIDPPRLMMCLSKANRTYRTARKSRFLAVHQLGVEQDELGRVFGELSGDWADKFARVPWHEGPHGLPVLNDAPAWLVGRVVDRYDLGDHVGFLLHPVASGRDDGTDPQTAKLMTLHDVTDMEPGHPA